MSHGDRPKNALNPTRNQDKAIKPRYSSKIIFCISFLHRTTELNTTRLAIHFTANLKTEMFFGAFQLDQSGRQDKEIADLRAPIKPKRKISDNASALTATSTTLEIIAGIFLSPLNPLHFATIAVEP